MRAAGEQLGDEVPGARLRQRVVEAEHQHRRRAGGREQLLALVQLGQPEPRHVRGEVAHRVRVESGDDRRAAFPARPFDRLGDDRLMPEMEAVEVAERDDRPAKGLGDGLAVIEPHSGCFS